VGGIVTALLQFYPVLHIFAGMCALWVVGLVSGMNLGGGRDLLPREAGSGPEFVIISFLTLLTGAIMIMVALVAVLVLSAVWSNAQGRSSYTSMVSIDADS